MMKLAENIYRLAWYWENRDKKMVNHEILMCTICGVIGFLAVFGVMVLKFGI